MKLKDLVKSTKTGIDVEFSIAKGKNGKVVMVVSGEDKYILGASIDNFQRFKKWIGEKTEADIKKTGKFFNTEYGHLPVIEIRTSVKVIDDEEEVNTIKQKTPSYSKHKEEVY